MGRGGQGQHTPRSACTARPGAAAPGRRRGPAHSRILSGLQDRGPILSAALSPGTWLFSWQPGKLTHSVPAPPCSSFPPPPTDRRGWGWGRIWAGADMGRGLPQTDLRPTELTPGWVTWHITSSLRASVFSSAQWAHRSPGPSLCVPPLGVPCSSVPFCLLALTPFYPLSRTFSCSFLTHSLTSLVSPTRHPCPGTPSPGGAPCNIPHCSIPQT